MNICGSLFHWSQVVNGEVCVVSTKSTWPFGSYELENRKPWAIVCPLSLILLTLQICRGLLNSQKYLGTYLGAKYQRTFGCCLYCKQRAALRHSRPNLSSPLGVVRLGSAPGQDYCACLDRLPLTQLCSWWAVWWQCPEHPALLWRLPFHCSEKSNGFLALTVTNWLTCFSWPETNVSFPPKNLQARNSQHFSGRKE